MQDDQVRELDFVEIIGDLPASLVAGAEGTAVAVFETYCMVEIVDRLEGFTLGIFDVQLDKVRVIAHYEPTVTTR